MIRDDLNAGRLVKLCSGPKRGSSIRFGHCQRPGSGNLTGPGGGVGAQLDLLVFDRFPDALDEDIVAPGPLPPASGSYRFERAAPR
jgi:hypothetical protein